MLKEEKSREDGAEETDRKRAGGKKGSEGSPGYTGSWVCAPLFFCACAFVCTCSCVLATCSSTGCTWQREARYVQTSPTH